MGDFGVTSAAWGRGLEKTGHRSAQAVDHIGPPRHPHRVTIMRLARAQETYELRRRENVRGDDGTVTRVRRTAPGGNSKAVAYARAEKVWRNLDRSGGYHGTPPVAALQATPPVRTLKQVACSGLLSTRASPPRSRATPVSMAGGIWPELTWTDIRTDTRNGSNPVTRRVELGAMPVEDIRPADINRWVQALAAMPDARCKGESVPVSAATVHAHLRVLKA